MTGAEKYVIKCEVLVALLLDNMEYDPTLLSELVAEGFVCVMGMVPYLTDKGKTTASVIHRLFNYVDELDMDTLEPKKED